ncbi:autotransporter-associated beta strand repeat-containing protein [Haloferula sp. BvORR071]|uniref:beta strand repeat-containing protein n=1 Tax=Haloferula sp. BvORR071 TaxID=1396141 RepID=UPI0005560C1B|nr:autotransporter-associated beta strand repeat-containing protein [Haloferula sp. BvORR071]
MKGQTLRTHFRPILPCFIQSGTALGMLLATAQAASYYKANNTSSLNQNASWVDQAGAAMATTPINGTGQTDIFIWDSRVAAANTVDIGGDLGLNTIKIVDPAGPVSITGTRTFTFTASGGVDMSLATQDLTVASGIFFRATGGVAMVNNVPGGRTLTLNCPINVRNNSSGGTISHPGAGTVIYNGAYTVSNLTMAAGEVRLNAASGSTRNGTNSTTINGGKLVINNTSGSATGSGAVAVNNSGTLTGQGSMSGVVSVASGGTLIPGAGGVGSLKAGGLNLAAGSVIKWEAVDALQSDLIEVLNSDGLVINGGTIELYNAGTTQPFTGLGTFNLFASSGAIGGSGTASLAVAESSKIPGQTYTFGVASGFVTLRIEVGNRPESFWNVNANGTWATAANWTANGVPNGTSAIANLGGSSGTPITAARTVTLGSPATVGILNIDSSQTFTVAGSNALIFDDGEAAATLHVKSGSHTISAPVQLPANGILAKLDDAAGALTIQGQISGDGGVGKSGPGTLILTGDSFYGGLTTNGAGTLQIGAGGTSGSVGGPIANNGVLRINRSDALSLSSQISGSGSVDFFGAGTTTLLSANTFSGPTTISAGTVEIGDPLALQNSTLTYSAASGTLTVSEFLDSITLGALSGDKPFPLANTVATPLSLTVGQNNASTSYTGSPAGTGTNFTKAGSGTFALTGTHAFTGNATVNGGVLSLDAGSSFSAGSVKTGAAGSKLLLNGGTLTASAQSQFTNASAGLDIVSGTANFNGGIISDNNLSSGNFFVHVGGGSLNTASLSVSRGALNLGTEPTTGQTGNGLYINGGAVDVAGNVVLGNNANSSVSARMDSGSLTVHGSTTVGIANLSRWSVLDIGGGSFTSTDAAVGVRIGTAFDGQSIMLVRGGVVKAERFQFGQADFAGSSILNLTAGTVYVGSGGMVAGSANAAMTARLRLGGGVLGAAADSASTVPVSLTGAAVVTGADDLDAPHAVTFSGSVDGSGSLTKSGSGSVSFTSPNVAFSGTVSVNSGSLGIGGQTGAVTVASGAALTPIGTLNAQAASTVNGKLAIRYDVEASVLPGHLHSQGVLTLGAGATLDFSGTGTLTAPYYIIASGSAGVSGTFTVNGALPAGYTLSYTHNNGSGFPVVALVGAASPYDTWAASYGLAGDSAAVDADPDQDGSVNLIEFGMGRNPIQGGGAGPVLGKSGNFLTLGFDHIAGGNISFRVEASESLSGDWTVVQTFPAFASAGTATYTDNVAMGSTKKRFLRLVVLPAN